MKNLTATICLAVALLLGSASMSWSEECRANDRTSSIDPPTPYSLYPS